MLHNHPANDDKPQDACGVFGIWEEGASLGLTAYRALFSLQHRGQESAGIAHLQNGTLDIMRGGGLVADALDQFALADWKGTAAIGHVRYAVAGQSAQINSQPLLLRSRHGQLALAHNGNLVNARRLRRELEAQGSIFYSMVDTEVIAHLMARSTRGSLMEIFKEALLLVRGSYSLLLLTPECLIAVRDPHGIRPLSLGQTGTGGYVLASETCAFDAIDATFIRDIEPGEIVRIDANGIESFLPAKPPVPALCAFEYVYIARNDSVIQGLGVHESRLELGRLLAQESPAEADIVVGVPDSSYAAAAGYADASGLPFKMGLNRNRYIGRTFIQPQQSTRAVSVTMKLSAVRSVVAGMRVVLIDDSLVRGTTMRHIVQMLWEAGTKEVHVRISSPPFVYPCYYGVDVATTAELVASDHDTQEICKMIGANSLSYLSLNALNTAMAKHCISTCTACFDGKYPVPPEL